MLEDNPRNFHGKYENFVETGEYDYGEYFSNINFSNLILDDTDNSHLVEGLGNFFYKEKQRELPNRNSKKAAFQKAKMMVNEGRLNYGNYLEVYNGENGLLDAVRQAVSKGYIWKFKIEEPWHPSVFFSEERIFTYPFQHRFAVLYTGQARHIFFSKLGKWDLLRADRDFNNYGIYSNKDWIDHISRETDKSRYIIDNEVREIRNDLKEKYDQNVPRGAAVNGLAQNYGLMLDYRNPESIIEQGAILTGNQHVKTDNEDDYDRQDYEKAVWLAFIDKAKNYPAYDEGTKSNSLHEKLYDNSVVFEVEVPSNWLAIKGHKGVDHSRIENIKDCKKNWESPKQMSKDLSRDDEFVIPESTGRLPINYIKGIWDKEEFPGTPHFMSKKKFVSLMNKRFSNRMPSSENHIKLDIKADNEELEELKKEFKEFSEIRRLADAASKEGEKTVRLFSGIRAKISELTENVNQLTEIESEIEELEDQYEEIKQKEQRAKEIYKEEGEMPEKYKGIRNKSISLTKELKELKNRKETTSSRVKDFLDDIRKDTLYLKDHLNEGYSRNGLVNHLNEEFKKVNIESDVSKISFDRYLEIKSDSEKRESIKQIPKEIMNAHKQAGKYWENNRYEKTEEIKSALYSDLSKKARNLLIIKLNPSELIELLPTSNVSTETKTKIAGEIKQGWEEAKK